ncbi:MAG: zinc-dependent metalloprotease [Halolamina sp.]
MNLFRSVRAVAGADGSGAVDWTAVADAAKASTDPGSLALSETERAGYRDDVQDARTRLQETAGLRFELPEVVEVQNRHHWIDANVATFRRVMAPLEADAGAQAFPGAARVVNTGTMALALSFLGRNVLGQYDPLLLAEEPAEEHALYFVRPNVVGVAEQLNVEYPRFRRWIAFHEVAHAAEFGAAPWLSGYLEARMESGIRALQAADLDRSAFRELNAAMTAVEGYAELLMDRAFDDDYADLRRKVDDRRGGGGPVAQAVRRLLGLGLKRQQYERGSDFFEAVADAQGVEAAGAVWDRPEALPTDEELGDPAAWLDRVNP